MSIWRGSAVVELGGAGRLVGGVGLGVLEAAAVEQEGRDAGGPEGVAAGRHTELGLAHRPGQALDRLAAGGRGLFHRQRGRRRDLSEL